MLIWGRVRPGTASLRAARAPRERRVQADGSRFATDDAGYFEVRRPVRAAYRFQAFESDDADAKPIGTSRAAAPTRPTGGSSGCLENRWAP